jgi:hypothetical protein
LNCVTATAAWLLKVDDPASPQAHSSSPASPAVDRQTIEFHRLIRQKVRPKDD